MSGAAVGENRPGGSAGAAPARPDAFVIGVGETEPVEQDARSIPEIVLEAVEAALADAGIGYADIDAVVTASVDLNDGLTASNIAVTEVVGAVMKPETRIAGDGLAALAHAVCLLWAGAYGTVLVVAHGKASMAPQDAISQWALDPVLLQSLGFGFDAYSGLQAQALAAADPGAVAHWAGTAATALGCGAEDVMDSALVADPLRESMRAPDADGACAVVLTARPAASGPAGGSDGDPRGAVEGFPRSCVLRGGGHRRNVLLTGVGFDLDQHLPGDRDLTAWTSLTRAFDRALGSAGISPEEIDFIEASCRYPHEAELFAAATGLQPGKWRAEATIPVAAGLSRFIAATRALRAESVPSTAHGLAHGAWGPAGQAHAVALLRAHDLVSRVDVANSGGTNASSADGTVVGEACQ